MIPLVLSGAALLLSLAALGLAVAVMRQSGAVATELRRHRLAHERAAHGRAERRQLNLGASRATGERRQPPQQPPELPEEDGGLEAPATAPQPATGPEEPQTTAIPRLPRPGQIGQR